MFFESVFMVVLVCCSSFQRFSLRLQDVYVLSVCLLLLRQCLLLKLLHSPRCEPYWLIGHCRGKGKGKYSTLSLPGTILHRLVEDAQLPCWTIASYNVG